MHHESLLFMYQKYDHRRRRTQTLPSPRDTANTTHGTRFTAGRRGSGQLSNTQFPTRYYKLLRGVVDRLFSV